MLEALGNCKLSAAFTDLNFFASSSGRVRRQHFLDPLAQVRVLATLLGEVRGPLIGREFAGGIEDFCFPISVCAHDTKGASTKDYDFPHSKRSNLSKATVRPAQDSKKRGWPGFEFPFQRSSLSR